MPRIKQYSDDYARDDFKKALRHGMTDGNMERKKDLSEASGIPYATLWSRLDNPLTMTLAELRKIVAVIPVAPDAILAVAGIERKAINKYLQERSEKNA